MIRIHRGLFPQQTLQVPDIGCKTVLLSIRTKIWLSTLQEGGLMDARRRLVQHEREETHGKRNGINSSNRAAQTRAEDINTSGALLPGVLRSGARDRLRS